MIEKNQKEQTALEVAKNSCRLYGDYVNNHRHIPLVFDGLKSVYRRTIYSALKLSGKQPKLIKTAMLVGDVMGKYHPHGDSSIVDVVTELVSIGIFDGQGNFGDVPIVGEISKAAKMRYTEVRVNQKWFDFFNVLLPYVPYVEAECGGGIKEPVYLPTPYPLCLSFGLFGMGFGTSSRVPNFSIRSMHEALLSDDPEELKPFYKLEMTSASLDDLWYQGSGWVRYSFKVYQGNSNDGNGIFIEGDTRAFRPDLSNLDSLINQKKIFTREESDANGQKLFIGKNYRMQVNLEELQKTCKTLCSTDEFYQLNVTDGEVVRPIPLKEWLSFCYENYLRLLEVMKADKVTKLEQKKNVQIALAKVADYFLNNRNADADEISKFTGIERSVVENCMKRSLVSFKRSNVDSGIREIELKIAQINSFEPKDYVSKLSYA